MQDKGKRMRHVVYLKPVVFHSVIQIEQYKLQVYIIGVKENTVQRFVSGLQPGSNV